MSLSPTTSEMRTFQKYFPCVRVRWNFVAIPQMAFQEEFQIGAIHRGKTVITIEGIVTTEEDLKEYKKKQEAEDFELLTAVDQSILAMKEEIDMYLAKAIEKEEKPKKEEERQSVFAPVIALIDGFKHMFKTLIDGFKHLFRIEKKQGINKKWVSSEFGAAKKLAELDSYLSYKIFKQSHGMITE